MSVPERFELLVTDQGMRPAVAFGDRVVCYDELNRRANRLANAVLEEGLARDEPVVVLFGGPLNSIVAQLAVLKTGRAVVPVDPGYPAARRARIAADSGSELLLTEAACAALADEMKQPGQKIILAEATESSASDRNLGVHVPPEANAYIFYTSGSTGEPKGVVQTHGHLLNLATIYTHDLRVGPEDRIACPTSLAYTGTVWALMGALLNGAAYVRFGFDSPERLVQAITRQRVTIAQLIVSLLRAIVRGLQGRADASTLRHVYTGGETLYWADVERFYEVFPADCGLLYDLGSTEAGIITHFLIDDRGAAQEWLCHHAGKEVVPCGRPVQGAEVLLLDLQTRQRVPEGQTGEMAVRGHHLSPGYWHKPDLTAASFVHDPDGRADRVFLTRDLGRILADGNLMHLGRRDFEVKIRGYRVNVAEVEGALGAIAGVKETAVATIEDNSGEGRLVAYLSFASGRRQNVSVLRRQLAKQLPQYMVPTAFVFMDELPRQPTGKIDRQALPKPDGSRPQLDVDVVAPRTPVEARLGGIWSEVLGVEPVGMADDFLDLGGTSLAAARILARVRDAFRVEPEVRLILEFPTVEQLAVRIVAQMAARAVTRSEAEERAQGDR